MSSSAGGPPLDPTKISIVSSKKTSVERFSIDKVDRLEGYEPKASPSQLQQPAKEQQCRLCCMAQGSFIGALTSMAVNGLGMAVYVFSENRVYYSWNGVVRQIMWLAIPGTLAGTTLHFFLSESMWSGRRSSWGQAWTGAFVANSVAWCSAIGCGTAAWRYGLKCFSRGRALQRQYPIPSEPLENRVMRSSVEFFRGMGWSYWLTGLASGQFGFMSTVAFCVYNDRPHYLMAPHGGYAMRCMPKWRRDFIEKNALK